MAVSQIIGFGGLKLASRVYGNASGPSVVLVPGASAFPEKWEQAAQALAAAGRHVVLLDMRGHGDSPPSPDGTYDIDTFVADLREVLRKLQSRPTVIAATLGAWVSLLAIGEGEPDLAAALVTIEASHKFDPSSIRKSADQLVQGTAVGGASWFDEAILDQIDPTQLMERLARAAAGIRVPTLLLRGAASDHTSQAELESLAELIRDTEIVQIPSAGQLTIASDSDELTAALLDFLERRVPRQPIEYIEGSDHRTLRDALGCFATGVTVVTTRAPDGTPVGLTANSFTSVSLDPPLLLVCPANNAGSLPAFEAAEHFAVNVLHIGQQDTSNLFASKGEDRFGKVDWECWENDVPILRNSLVNFECRKYAMHDGGDHQVLIGEVVRAKFEPCRDPILFFRGKYRKLHFA